MQDYETHQDVPLPYARVNFDKLFGIAKGMFDAKPELIVCYPPNEAGGHIASINAIFDRLGKYTSQASNKGRRAIGKAPLTKVGKYKAYVDELIENGAVSPNIVHHFLYSLCKEDGSHLKLARTVREAMVLSPECDPLKAVDLATLIRARVNEIASILPQNYRSTKSVAQPELPLYCHRDHPTHARISERSDLRIYINPSIFGDPKFVVQNMKKALNGHSDHWVYFEVNGLGRQDAITLYCGEDDYQVNDGKMCSLEKILATFVATCQTPALLINGSHPLGFALARGISLAAEPPINFLLDLNSYGKSSSNRITNFTLAALMMLCAFSIAKSEETNASFDLQRSTECYYRQLQMISKINPDTLMSMNVNGGEIPTWAKTFQARYCSS